MKPNFSRSALLNLAAPLEALTELRPRTEGVTIPDKFADHLEELLSRLDPDAMGEAYRSAVETGNAEAAVSAAAAHFRSKASPPVPELCGKGAFSIPAAEEAAAGHMCEVSVPWDFPDGKIDFLFDPTEVKGPRNHEWVWQLNRHGFWHTLGRAYTGTGDERYARAFAHQLTGWLAETDCPIPHWNGPGSAWRTIECGLRLMGSWAVAFDAFRRSPEVPDALLLVMIASMHRQAIHLREHPQSGNWLMMESAGVYTFASLFPELDDAEELRILAAERVLRETDAQTLPDGMHDELSPDYQWVVLHCSSSFFRLARAMNRENEIPPAFTELLERTVHAAILLSTPRFTQPRTNDTYTIPTSVFTEYAAKYLPPKPEYDFVNTKRECGAPPKGSPSALLPWAGFAVLRSGWEADAAYLCFDAGPLGMGHMHQDKLNINLYKGSEELIFDDGGGQYEQSEARAYGVSGYGHNTVLVDGLAQNRRAPLRLTEPAEVEWRTAPESDSVSAVYDGEFGSERTKPAIHRREVTFVKPDFFCVTDTLTSADGLPHEYEVLFQLDTVKIDPVPGYEGAVLSDFGRTWDVLIVPIPSQEEPESPTEVVSAQTNPCRGWYVGRNDAHTHPASTVSRKAAGLTHRFTTLLFPVKRGEPLPELTVEKEAIWVTFRGKTSRL